jgi:hypothetical protein
MLEDFFDDILLFYDDYDLHDTRASGACEWIDLPGSSPGQAAIFWMRRAQLLIAEITDFRRFPNARSLMAFLGLIPSEDSSGNKIRPGSITKAGNSRVRKHIIEAVQHYARTPKISRQMKEELSQVDAQSASIAVNCLKRLHKRYWYLTLKGKIRPKALTAIAREFVGFIWAVMQPEPIAI